jgi:hypothetical protein
MINFPARDLKNPADEIEETSSGIVKLFPEFRNYGHIRKTSDHLPVVVDI